MRIQRGVVLLTTLFMITILSLLVITFMNSLSLYLRADHTLERKQQLLQQLEKISVAYLSRNALFTNLACVITDDNPNASIDYLLHQSGCVFTSQKHPYYYVIADLGEYPCQKISVDGTQYTSHHWLFTVASEGLKPSMLQLRLAVITPDRRCETKLIQFIPPGVLSWRYLP